MQLTTVLTSFSDMYKTPVVLFQEAIEHVLRIVRVMRQPSGHMLFIGIGGMGNEQSLGSQLLLHKLRYLNRSLLKNIELLNLEMI